MQQHHSLSFLHATMVVHATFADTTKHGTGRQGCPALLNTHTQNTVFECRTVASRGMWKTTLHSFQPSGPATLTCASSPTATWRCMPPRTCGTGTCTQTARTCSTGAMTSTTLHPGSKSLLLSTLFLTTHLGTLSSSQATLGSVSILAFTSCAHVCEWVSGASGRSHCNQLSAVNAV